MSDDSRLSPLRDASWDSTRESTRDGLFQMVQQNDEKHEAGHKRLRESIGDISDRVESNFNHFDQLLQGFGSRLTLVEQQASKPIDAMTLIMSTKSIIGLVGAAATIVAMFLSVQNSVSDLRKTLETQRDLNAAAARVQELQMKTLSDAAADAKATAADAKRQYELLRYEFQGLKDALQKGK